MKLYSLYLKFILQNALKFPKQAGKIIPGLSLLVIGVFWSLYKVNFEHYKLTTDTFSGMISPIITYLLVIGLTLYSLSNKAGIINARASDANFLMPAPITPFQLSVFMELKTMFTMIGFIFIFIAFYGTQTLSVLHNKWLIYPIFLSPLLSLYIFSYIVYIAKVSKDVVGRAFKLLLPLLIVGYMAIGAFYIYSFTQYNISVVNVLSPILEFYPVIGWTMSLMNYLIVFDIGYIMLFTSLLIGTFVAILYLAKVKTRLYYEEELAYIQKTEAVYKKAFQGKNSRVKTKFVQGNKQLVQFNEKILLDMAWVKVGKYWFLKLSLLLKPLVIAGVTYIGSQLFLSRLEQTANEGNVQKYLLLSLIGVFIYARIVAAGKRTVDNIINDFYVNLMPFKPIYKLLYPLVVKFVMAIITSLLLCILFTVVYTNYLPFNFLVIAQVLLTILLQDIFDLLRVNLLQPMALSPYLGNFVMQIVETLIILGSAIITIAPIYYMDGISGLPLTLLILIVLNSILLYISTLLFNRTEKCKKENEQF